MNTCTATETLCVSLAMDTEDNLCEVDLEFYGCATREDLEEAA